MKKNIYYVYAYLDPTKEGSRYGEYNFPYEPFYIGKGSNDRNKIHLKGNIHNKEIVERISYIKQKTGVNPVIIKLWENLYEDDAYNIEWKAIKTIGTIYSPSYKGPLLNKAFTNVLDVQLYGNTSSKTYIMEHPYVKIQEINVGKFRFLDFCEKLKIDANALINGEIVDGWKLDII